MATLNGQHRVNAAAMGDDLAGEKDLQAKLNGLEDMKLLQA